MATYLLDELLKAIQSAVIDAQQSAERQQLTFLNEYFTRDDKTGALRPKTVDIITGAHPGDVLRMPLFSLVPSAAIKMKEISVEFRANLAEIRGAADKERRQGQLELKAVGLLSASTPADVRITFAGVDLTEGAVLLNGRLLKQIP